MCHCKLTRQDTTPPNMEKAMHLSISSSSYAHVCPSSSLLPFTGQSSSFSSSSLTVGVRPGSFRRLRGERPAAGSLRSCPKLLVGSVLHWNLGQWYLMTTQVAVARSKMFELKTSTDHCWESNLATSCELVTQQLLLLQRARSSALKRSRTLSTSGAANVCYAVGTCTRLGAVQGPKRALRDGLTSCVAFTTSLSFC